MSVPAPSGKPVTGTPSILLIHPHSVKPCKVGFLGVFNGFSIYFTEIKEIDGVPVTGSPNRARTECVRARL